MEIQCVQWKVARVSVESWLGTDLITEDVPISPLTVPLGSRQADRQRHPVDDAPHSEPLDSLV